MVYVPKYMTFWKRQIIRTENRLVVSRSWGGSGNYKGALHGGDGNVLYLDCGVVALLYTCINNNHRTYTKKSEFYCILSKK